ncbi:hypothetical protein [uncultured Clostridium sp.]|uniref:hypothetical protein n=1 Tax=uncultured Clostridium sp. TaxID=59620 RepID=UPI00258AE927|nr:hypothetical protein [uncultured Clostridium sp.]
MSIIEGNCPNCCKREKFELTEKNNYRCMSCNSKFHKCKSKECNNMINYGLFCSKCTGKGLKKGGSLAATAAVAIVGVGVKLVLGAKGSRKS